MKTRIVMLFCHAALFASVKCVAQSAYDTCEAPPQIISEAKEQEICDHLGVDTSNNIENDEMAHKNPFKLCGNQFQFTIPGLPNLLNTDFNVCDIIKDDINDIKGKMSAIDAEMAKATKDAFQAIDAETSGGLQAAGFDVKTAGQAASTYTLNQSGTFSSNSSSSGSSSTKTQSNPASKTTATPKASFESLYGK